MFTVDLWTFDIGQVEALSLIDTDKKTETGQAVAASSPLHFGKEKQSIKLSQNFHRSPNLLLHSIQR